MENLFKKEEVSMFDPKYFAMVTGATVKGLRDYLASLPNQDAEINVEGDNLFYIHVEEDGSLVNFDDNMMLEQYKDDVDEALIKLTGGTGRINARTARLDAIISKRRFFWNIIDTKIDEGETECQIDFNTVSAIDIEFLEDLIHSGFDLYIPKITMLSQRCPVIVDWFEGKPKDGEFVDLNDKIYLENGHLVVREDVNKGVD
jgi:hypothetical protein